MKIMSDIYSEELDTVDASIFSGEMLETNLEELKDYVGRWQRAIDAHEKAMEEKV